MQKFISALVAIATCAQINAFQEIGKNDLYEHFFGIDNSKACKKNTSCKMLRRHIARDSKKCVMKPEEVGAAENYVLQSSGNNSNNVTGTIRYLGTVPGKYGYDTFVDATGALVIESRIHFSNINTFEQSDIDYLKKKLQRAADVWTRNNSFTDYPVRFRLLLEENRRKAHISAKLLTRRTRGPYFSKWYLYWSDSTMAHEFGHILGLDDEYANNPFGGSIAGCSTRSIMCYSQGGTPQNYHYYVIFRRLLCK